MEIRWLKKYYVATSPTRMGHDRKVLHQEKVLQVKVNGIWADIPSVNDEDGYSKAKVLMSEKKKILGDNSLVRLEAEMEEVASRMAENDDE